MLAGCSTAYQGGPAGSPQSVAGGAPVPPGTPQTVAILLPLTGPRADLAQPMLQAAQLALSAPGAPRLVQQDTAGTPAGATHAMQTAMAAGARLILGPLTAPEVLAVAPIARQAQIPVLAFSNDTAVAQPGVWPLGITPGEQVRRLVGAGRAAGKTQFAAFLPDSDFGHALGNALSQAVTAAGLAPPNVQFHGPGMNAINQGMQSLSDYESRSGGQHVGEVSTTAVPPPPPFDALLLGDVGEPLAELASILQYYFVGPPAVQIMGPGQWADPASRSGQLRGAWFAAADPTARQPFVQAFMARYGSPPRPLSDLAYDAASIARVTAPSGFAIASLTAPSGYLGADGWLALLPSGDVRRALAVFQTGPGGPQVVQPPPSPGTA